MIVNVLRIETCVILSNTTKYAIVLRIEICVILRFSAIVLRIEICVILRFSGIQLKDNGTCKY